MNVGTENAVMSLSRYTVIRTLWFNIDRQGNRTAEYTKVIEGVGCIRDTYYSNPTFSSLVRFMKLTFDYDYYLIPFSTTVSIMVQSETYSK